MQYTNNLNLPKAYVRAVKNDPYDKGDADFSSTGLLVPPQQAKLVREHHEEVVEDVADRVWAMFGSSAHYVLEQSAKPWRNFMNKAFDSMIDSELSSYRMGEDGKPELVDNIGMEERLREFADLTRFMLAKALRFQEMNQIYSERRYFAEIEVDGEMVMISGQIDLTETTDNLTDLCDLKTVSVWGIVNVKDKMEDFQGQLSINRWLAHKNGKHVDSTSIVAIIRDWSQNKAREEMRNSYNNNPNYPQKAIISIPVPMMTLEETEEFIRIKVRGLKAEVPRECSDKDIWLRESCYALFNKKGLKRASKLIKGKGEQMEKDANEALSLAKQDPKKKDAYLEFRAGVRPRCEDYCSAAPWCQQFQNHLKELESK